MSVASGSEARILHTFTSCKFFFVQKGINKGKIGAQFHSTGFVVVTPFGISLSFKGRTTCRNPCRLAGFQRGTTNPNENAKRRCFSLGRCAIRPFGSLACTDLLAHICHFGNGVFGEVIPKIAHLQNKAFYQLANFGSKAKQCLLSVRKLKKVIILR